MRNLCYDLTEIEVEAVSTTLLFLLSSQETQIKMIANTKIQSAETTDIIIILLLDNGNTPKLLF